MTVLTVASSLFTLPSGKHVITPSVDLSIITVSQIKALLEDEFGCDRCPSEACRLFWHGYLLADENTVLESCRGVKEGEVRLCMNIVSLYAYRV